MTKKLKAAVHIFGVRQSQLKIRPQLKLVKISGEDFLTSSTIKTSSSSSLTSLLLYNQNIAISLILVDFVVNTRSFVVKIVKMPLPTLCDLLS